MIPHATPPSVPAGPSLDPDRHRGRIPAGAGGDPEPADHLGDRSGRFDVGNVDLHALLLVPAERADVVVDFSAYAGKTLILYNDAPAAFPARDPRYDYYTGDPDRRDAGGPPSTLPGYGPNTRTVMQVKIAGSPGPAFNVAALEDAFASTSIGGGGVRKSQHPIIVGQAGAQVGATGVGAYNWAYGTNFARTGWCNNPANPTDRATAWRGSSTGRRPFRFDTLEEFDGGPSLTIPLQPKAIHDEMRAGAYDPVYGRMSSMLGVEVPNAQAGLQNVILYPYWTFGLADVMQGVEVSVGRRPAWRSRRSHLRRRTRSGRSRTTAWTPTRSTSTCSTCR